MVRGLSPVTSAAFSGDTRSVNLSTLDDVFAV